MTIAAISTAPVTSAIGVIRISGEDAFSITEKIFSKPLACVKGYTAVYGNIHDGEKIIDTVIATVFHAPHSYTGENTVELSCHGSPYIMNRIVDLLVSNGAVRAGRGEFSKRAFVNGKMDIAQAEAVIDLIEAQTEYEIDVARGALTGRISEKTENIRAKLISLSADILAYIDYPDEDIADVSQAKTSSVLEDVLTDIKTLSESYNKGRIIKNGVRTVICGKPNAGKSMLMNRILGCERSIVTSAEGTTRDVVGESAVFGGIKLDIRDTAGIREAFDEVEKIGVGRAESEIENADMIIFVYDLSRACDKNDLRVLASVKKSHAKKIVVLNKSDCDTAKDVLPDFGDFDICLKISAMTGYGISSLENAVKQLNAENFVNSEVIMNMRQYECFVSASASVENALKNISFSPDVILDDIEEAIKYLGNVTGKSVGEEIIADIFSRFCIGK